MDDIQEKIAKAKAGLPTTAYEFPASTPDDLQARIERARSAYKQEQNETVAYEFPATNPSPAASVPQYGAPQMQPTPEAKESSGWFKYAGSSNDFAYRPPMPDPEPAPAAPKPESPPSPTAPPPVILADAPLVKVRDAGWQPGSKSEQISLGMDPESLKEARSYADEAHIQRMLANNSEVETAKERGEAQAAYAAGVMDVAKQYTAATAALNAERKAYTEKELNKQAAISEKLKQRVDPNRFWTEKSTAAQIGLAISMGLGAFAATIGKTENFALRIVERAIDNDIKSQQINLEANKDELEASKSAYAQNLAAFGDKERALLATKINGIDAAKTQLDAAVAKLGTKEAEARGAKAAAELYDLRAKILTEFAERTHNKVVQAQTANWAPAQYAGGPGSGGIAQKPMKDLVQLDDGTALNIPDEKRRNLTSERLEAGARLRSLYANAQEKRQELKKFGNGSLSDVNYRAAYQQLDKLATDIAYTESILRGQGVVRPNEMEEFKKTSPFLMGFLEPSAWGTDWAKTAWRDLSPALANERDAADKTINLLPQRLDREIESAIRTSGGTIVRPALTRDKFGQIVPTYVETGVFNRPATGTKAFNNDNVETSEPAIPPLGERLQLQQNPQQNSMPLRGPRER